MFWITYMLRNVNYGNPPRIRRLFQEPVQKWQEIHRILGSSIDEYIYFIFAVVMIVITFAIITVIRIMNICRPTAGVIMNQLQRFDREKLIVILD
jgi:hypothetical protein